MKVLLMAYECSPFRGSEWAVGWGRLLQAARIAETHVVTSESNFQALTQAQTESLLPPNVRFHTPAPDATLLSLERTPALFAYNYRAYHHWQKLALALVRDLHAAEHFDLVHQVNVCTFREPGYTWQLDIPYLWGPVGGSQNFPPRFLSMLPPAEAFKEAMRGLSNLLSLRFKPRVRRAAKAAAVLIAANSTNLRDYRRVFHRPVDLLLETGLHAVEQPDRARFLARLEALQSGRPLPPLRLLWSGAFESRKALPILLRALARTGAPSSFALTVLGDGPMRQRWMDESARLGLAVTFLGRLPFAEAVAQMHSADLFCFTSLRDTSGNVVLEALAAGVPVVCFDHQGAGDMVSESSGVKLPISNPRAAVTGWARTLASLAADPARLLRLSQGATEQARLFLWERNGDRINALYRDLAARTRKRSPPVSSNETMAS